MEGYKCFIINKDGNLEFKITQSSFNCGILFMIKKKLDFGLVEVQDFPKNTYCYIVKDKKNILELISIFNGNIFLDTRKKEFKLWLVAFNLKYKQSIPVLNNRFKPSLNDAWISGFTEAQGRLKCST